MSREKFSKKSPGDRLTDGFVNRLSKAVQRVAGGRSGSYGMHHEGDSIESHSAFPPWQQRDVIVVSTDEAPADEDGLYLVSPRWYSHRDKEWKTNEDVKWLLDARDSDMSFSEEETLVAYWDAQRGAWVPVSSNNLVYFELKTDLTPGSTATAYRLDDDLERIDTDPPNETWKEETVKDILGTTRGKGADDEATPALKGTILTARKVGDEWHIVTAQPWPLLITGLLTTDLETTDATFKIDGVAVMNPVGAIAAGHLLDESDEVTVYNVFKWEGDNNGRVVAAWNETTGRWEAIQVECPA